MVNINKKYISIISILFLIIFSVSAQDNFEKSISGVTDNQLNYDVHYYKLDLDFDTNDEIITGNVKMQAQIINESIDRVEIDFSDVLSIDSVKLDGEIASFNHSGLILTVDLIGLNEPGTNFDISVFYHGTPLASLGFFKFDIHGGTPMIWSISDPWGARHWWPCKDYPYDKPDSVDIYFTVPNTMTAVSNGKFIGANTLNNKTTYHYFEKHPITTYLISIAAYNYTYFEDTWLYGENDTMPLNYYVFPENLTQASISYGLVPEMLDTLSEMFGQYPFADEKYGYADYQGWAGGMEHQTISSMTSHDEYTVVHELSHQWWGDMLSCGSFQDIWLNEGFAIYTEALWGERKYGIETLHNIMGGYTYFGSGTVIVENPETEEIFGYGLTYKKAGWVVHMLRHIVGDENFFTILKNWVAGEHAYDIVNTDDFVELCEEISGMELSYFFDEWIYNEGFPIYTLNWSTHQSENDFIIDLSILQNQAGQIFKMPIDITITTASGEETFVVMDSLQGQTFQLTFNEEPLNVILDKDNWILHKNNTGNYNLLATHDVGNCKLTMSAFANIGFNSLDEMGEGFVYPIDGNNHLRFGELILGNSTSYLVDNSRNGYSNDWEVSTTPPGYIHIGSTSVSDQDTRAWFKDTGHPTPKGIRIKQKSYAWADTVNDDYIIIEYEVKNTSSQDISELYIGQLLDFDVDANTLNYINIDNDNNLISMWDDNYSGLKLLSNNAVANLSAIDNSVSIIPEMTESDKFNFLTGDLNYSSDELANYSCLGSYGPFNLDHGKTKKFSFAIIGGEDMTDFNANAQAAQVKYDLVVSINEAFDNIVATKLYPNPSSGFMIYEYDTSLVEDCQLELYNESGEIIKTYYDIHSGKLIINTSEFTKGLYILKLISFNEVISLEKLLVE